MYHNFTLSPELLFNLSGNRDFISELAAFNTPVHVVLILFEFSSPIAGVLNIFVFISCLAILAQRSCERPALVFIAFNSLLDIFITLADAIVITGAVNPTIADAKDLPSAEELEHRCSQEKALVSFTMFSSMGSVMLLTIDRFIFITKPLTYSSVMTLTRAFGLTIAVTVIAISASIWYSCSVFLPWDKVCTFTHVLPIEMVIFWNALFFVTWISLHAMYLIILAVALRHRKAICRASSSNISSNAISSTSESSDSNNELIRSKSSWLSIKMSNDRLEIRTVIKTIRYVVILLVVYSLVELPCVTVAVEDTIVHMFHAHSVGDNDIDRCDESLLDEVDDHSAINLLKCMQRFISGNHAECPFETESASLESLPWCAMLSATSHSLYLTRLFTLALCGWMVNALADPIVYAFWYPVFRENLCKMCSKVRSRVNLNFSFRSNDKMDPNGPPEPIRDAAHGIYIVGSQVFPKF